MLIKQITSGKLKSHIFSDRKAMGAAAARECAARIRELLAEKDSVNIIFAAAPSQNEMLSALIAEKDIDWGRVNAFHMDEYLGLEDDDERRFSNFLKNAIFSKLPFKKVFYIKSRGEADALIKEYSDILKNNPTDIVCLGIGENGHIAFNDPHVADFNDSALIKVVDLDDKCRTQQVNDGCFEKFEDVPKYAFTLTIPALTRAKHLICTVPASTKAEAVFNTIYGKIGEECPATVMREHASANMYLDIDSAKYVLFKKAVITDEISQDIETACELAAKYKLAGIEVRSVFDTAPENLNDEQIEKIKLAADKYNLEIVAISSSIYKCSLGESQAEKLEKTVKLAKKLGAKYIRAFSYWKDENFSIDAFAEELKGQQQYLKENGLKMVIELDPSVNLTNGKQVAALLEKVNSPYVRAVWDPGNDIYEPNNEVPYPDGYNYIKDYTAHIHLKDAVKENGEVKGVVIGLGKVDYNGQFKALLKDDYQGYIVVETHYKLSGTISEELLKNPRGSAFSDGGYESTEAFLIELEKVIDRAVKDYAR